MVEIEPCFSCSGEEVSGEYQRGNGHRYGCACGASGPFRRAREQALAEWNRIASQRWRPIETAPRDGTSVFLWWPYWSGHPVIGHCLSSGQWQSRAALHAGWDDPDPTHWRPLPEPPEPPPIQTSGYYEVTGKEPLP